ncbi:MAG: hypothetical protein ISR90_04810 [Candidatus Marinimicrobia bacterium]|nr:hypothetical protein [Candidatus Neomarinimicrobiota bacterium]MBL7023358.1 hypothetical protein [Candidatus Neomarinimicrobiota bacterium]MBL7109317.1 hypothetical protein [Candidatus Neomarinimicrobiota bacterium]
MKIINDIEKRISLLDWGILIVIIIMLTIVYLPSSIWREEVKFRTNSRQQMTDIAEAEEFYKELIGSYTTNGEELFSLVEAAMDSLIADSLFVGEQKIYLNDKVYEVNMSKGFHTRVDTTFSFPQELKRTFLDTIYAVGMINEEEKSVDTIFVNAREIENVKKDELFSTIFSSDTTRYSEYYTDYLRDKYHLTPDRLLCPLIGEPYLLEIDSSDSENTIFSVKSPVPEDYTEPRYGIFKFEAGWHGEIIDGRKSWAEDN